MNAKKLSALLVAGIPLVYACGGDNLTLPGEGEPAHITVMVGSDGQSARVGDPLPNPLVVKVTDTQDRPVNGATVNFTFDDPTAGGSALPGSGTTDANGQASSIITLGSRVGLITGHATVPVPEGTVPVTIAFTATALPANANGIAAVSGDGQNGQVGAPLAAPLVVRVTDGFGNPVAGIPVDWSVTGGGSVSPTSTQTDGNGLASVTRTLGNTAGQQTTLATSENLAGSPVTFTHQANAGNASRVEIVSGNGQNAQAGTELPQELVVRVLDGSNNPISGRAVEWVIGEGGGTPTPGRSNTDNQGLARTRWTLGPTPGRNTLNAVVSGVGEGRVEFTATGTTGGSTTRITSIQPDESTVGQAVTVAVSVTGNGGTPTGSVTVTGESVAQPCTITLANGSGSCSITFTAAGNHEVTATYAGDSRFGGSSDSDTHRVNAANAAPTAAFTVESCEGLTCQFSDRSRDTDGRITKWEWTFGDGGTSDDQDPSHTYAASGIYTVTLKVTDDDGATSEASTPVEVNQPPTAGNDPSGGGAYQAVMNVPLTIPAPTLFANDSDPEGETLTAELGVQAAHGTATVDPAGGFTYTPDPGYTGADQFTYHVTDQHAQVSNEATVSIFVNP